MRKAALASLVTAGVLVWALLLMPALSAGAAPGLQASTPTPSGTELTTTTATAETTTTATEATTETSTVAATTTTAATATTAAPSTLPSTGESSGNGWVFLIIAVVLFAFGMLTLATRHER